MAGDIYFYKRQIINNDDGGAGSGAKLLLF